MTDDNRNKCALIDAKCLEHVVEFLREAHPTTTITIDALTLIAARLRSGFYFDGDRTPQVFGLKVYEQQGIPPGMVIVRTQDGKPPIILHIEPDDTEGGAA